MFTDSLCPLCEEEGERPCLVDGVNEQRNVEDTEQNREHKISSINKGHKEEKSKKIEAMAKGFVEMNDEYNNEKGAGLEIGESENEDEMTEWNKSKHDVGIRDDASGDLVPSTQEKKSILQLDSSSPVNLVMVCEESVQNSVNEELMICPAKSLTLSQNPLTSSPPSQNPLPSTIPPGNPSVLQLQTQPVVQTQGSVSMPVPQAPCLTRLAYESSPAAESQTLTHSGKVEISLQQVYTTRRYTRFTSRSVPLKSVHTENSSQPLPCVSNTSLLAPAPKKKTRTSYSTGE